MNARTKIFLLAAVLATAVAGIFANGQLVAGVENNSQKDKGFIEPPEDCDFSSTGSNEFFILEPGYRLVLTGEGDQGEDIRLTITVKEKTKVVDGVETRVENTGFFSPGYLTFGPGFYWKKSENLKVNLAPLTSKFTFVNSDYTSGIGYVDGSYFGVDANKSMRYELGFYASAYYKFILMKNVTAENFLSLYSNYLDKPLNIDIDYQINIVMTINKTLSANFTFQTIYDDNAFQGFQTREVFGLGVNYNF